MEELVQVLFEEPSVVKLSDYGIRTIKDRTILAPGFWNGRHYSKEEIIKCFNNTDWNDPDVISLIADHRDDDKKGRPLTIRDWLGYTSNHYLTENGYIKADLNLCNPTLATQLIDGKAPFGLSPFVYGQYDTITNSQKNFIFKNTAVVVEPACKESYINAYLNDDGENIELKNLSNEERMKTKLGETGVVDVRGKEVESHGLQPVKTKKKKKLNFIQLKGGQTNMENKEKLEDEKPTEEKKVDEVSEPVEEAEEVTEESEDEESEDKLMEQLAKITEKLMNKRKITPEMAKMQKLESEITSLRNEIKKLSEVKAEVKTEATVEKLSAKPRTIAHTVQTEQGFSVFGKGASQGSREVAAMLGY